MSTAAPSAQKTDTFPLDRGYLFSSNGTGREIDADSAAEWLNRKNDRNGEFVWLHFHDIPAVLDNWPLQHAVRHCQVAGEVAVE